MSYDRYARPDCPWCKGSDAEPEDAAAELCLDHLAEHEGTTTAQILRENEAEDTLYDREIGLI